MFTLSREEHSIVTRSSDFAAQTRVKRWAAWTWSAGLAVSIAGALVFVVSQIAFGREPIGGTSGLVLLYAATAIAGIGLGVFGRIAPIAWRPSGLATSAPYSTEGSLPPKAGTDAREAA